MSTITLRSVKGSGLTNNEIDANFTNLNTDKIEATQTVTLTNKTLALGSNTISGTTAQFNTALTDGDFATLAGTETLTNKTLTSPAINGGVIDTTSTTATAAVGTSSTRLANTAFVQQEKEYLPALSQSLHIGAVVKAIVYDTSKDSDGGAWRMRCADKSWYTETLGGDRWIGQHATIAAAWTAAGSTTGAVYQASATAGAQTSGLFYTPTSSTTVTQVYRGVTREFPAVAGIVAESARVVIYDLSNGAMWMVVSKATGYMVDSVPTSICAQNGQIIIGSTGLFYIALLQDAGFFQNTSNKYKFGPNIAGRNAAGTYAVSSAGIGIVSSTVNDVALTVLDSSPIDPATGLPVPTIAVATAGGVSVIKDDGTVVNSTSVAVAINSVTFRKGSTTVLATRDTAATAVMYLIASPYSSHTQYDSATAPFAYAAISAAKLLGATAMPSAVAAGFVSGLQVFKENPTTPTKGMVAYVTTAYNSGWLPGDIRGAYLADTTAETVTASGELVTNGTFATDTSGWTDHTGADATPSVVAGKLRLTRDTANAPSDMYQSFATVVGKTYTFSMSFNGTAIGFARIATTSNGYDLIETGTLGSSFAGTFVATTTTTYVALFVYTGAAGTYAEFDNISCRLASPDRSVKNKGLVINGSLTKTAVASGAGLVAWSGFSAANYLEQPYNSDLDFGTGDFCVMGWVKRGSGTESILERNSVTAGAHLLLNTTATTIYVYGSVDATDYTMVSAAYALSTTNYNFVAALRQSGTVYLYIDGTLVASGANSVNLTNAAAVLRIGNRLTAGTPHLGSLALWRISATAPSADQIAHIYRTELPLFQASAQCTIAGSSTAVTALAFDDTTELLHVGTSWGRTGFKDLLRVDSEATTTGALTSLSASQGVIITGGTSGKVYVPAMLLRDELRRKDEARKALGKVPVFQEFDAVTSQVAFVVAKGYTVKAVYSAGTLKRIGSTKDYTISDDGFQETITFAVAPGNTVWVSAMTVRK